jgi:hypothetical protein
VLSVAKKSVPLVAWTEKQEAALSNNKFLAVLEWLGLELPETAGQSFPLIPASWSSDVLFSAAAKLAPETPHLSE